MLFGRAGAVAWIACATVALVHSGARSGTGAAPLPCGVGDGTLIKGMSSAKVYVTVSGRAWLITDEARFLALGLDFEDVCWAPDEVVDHLERGPNVGEEGTFFRCPACPDDPETIYRIAGGARSPLVHGLDGLGCLGARASDVFPLASHAFRELWPPGAVYRAECGPESRSREPCDEGGWRERRCGLNCTWEPWGTCVVEPTLEAPEDAPLATRPTGCGSGPARGPVFLLVALAAVRLRARSARARG